MALHAGGKRRHSSVFDEHPQRTPIEADSVGGSGKVCGCGLAASDRVAEIVDGLDSHRAGVRRRSDDDAIGQDRLAGRRKRLDDRLAARLGQLGLLGSPFDDDRPDQPGIRVAMMLNRDAPIGENRLVPGRKSLR